MSFSAGAHSFSGCLGFLAKPKPIVLMLPFQPKSSRSKVLRAKSSKPSLNSVLKHSFCQSQENLHPQEVSCEFKG
jgi:hypothetical protein